MKFKKKDFKLGKNNWFIFSGPKKANKKLGLVDPSPLLTSQGLGISQNLRDYKVSTANSERDSRSLKHLKQTAGFFILQNIYFS